MHNAIQMKHLNLKSFLCVVAFTLFFSAASFAQAETEPNNTQNEAGVQTITTGVAFTGNLTTGGGGDFVDFWEIADGTSGNITLTFATVNYQVFLKRYSDAGRTTEESSNEFITGMPQSLDGAKFYSIQLVVLSTDAYSITPTVSLPVELTAFDATPTTTSVLLNWTTETELNNDYFEIQHSVDGQKFEVIGTVLGAGTSLEAQEYGFEHDKPVNGTNYYRLRQVDFDGAFEISQTVVAEFSRNTTDFTLAPSVANSYVNILFDELSDEKAMIEIYNISGVLVKQMNISSSEYNYNLDVSTFQNGQYIIRYTKGSDVVTKQFIKF